MRDKRSVSIFGAERDMLKAVIKAGCERFTESVDWREINTLQIRVGEMAGVVKHKRSDSTGAYLAAMVLHVWGWRAK